MKKTEFQNTHKPVKVIEHKCIGTKDSVDGMCGLCGRFLKRNGAHLPDREGFFGYTLVYSDGSRLESNTKE